MFFFLAVQTGLRFVCAISLPAAGGRCSAATAHAPVTGSLTHRASGWASPTAPSGPSRSSTLEGVAWAPSVPTGLSNRPTPGGGGRRGGLLSGQFIGDEIVLLSIKDSPFRPSLGLSVGQQPVRASSRSKLKIRRAHALPKCGHFFGHFPHEFFIERTGFF